VSTTIPQLSNHAVLEVGPGDEEAATAVEAWLGEYATSRDPVLRQEIILAYLVVDCLPGWDDFAQLRWTNSVMPGHVDPGHGTETGASRYPTTQRQNALLRT
jgi:hypothetical protein